MCHSIEKTSQIQVWVRYLVQKDDTTHAWQILGRLCHTSGCFCAIMSSFLGVFIKTYLAQN